MRFLVYARIPAEAGNKMFQDPKQGASNVEQLMNKLRPEAAYIVEEWGQRTFLFVVDIASVDMMPVIAEPLFQMNAKVEFHPAMVLSDLKKGLQR
jgi:hypothetical protein